MKKLLLCCLLMAVSSSALASKCYIREYSDQGTSGSGVAPVAREPALIDQTPVDFSGGVASSAAFNASTTLIRVWCDVQASFVIGASPTAANTNSPIGASTPEYFGVRPGHKISFIGNP